MKKYIAYYRVSTQKQSLGLQAQQANVSNFIQSNMDNILISEYSEKESGKYNNRVELNKALSECKQQGATLIIAKLDRLSRNISFVFELKQSGIEFLALDLPQFNTLTLAVFMGLAQQERELISTRTKAALKAKKEQGYKLGRPNASFTKQQINNASIKRKAIADNNDNTKRAKLMIAALIKSTKNKSEIARQLNENGFRTAKDKLFNAKAIDRIIKRYSLY
ncbi:recombinase family protein [Bacteroides fragilis]|uniref:recombinase family protein n=1 Tax=Bacteroides TaxID=816 RepID=UPI00202E236D|nr:recombinase family protein [Bacteroides fragilis]MCM0207405.1 recombinase family protein [Bacteroides fragilis]MCX8462827.1 recombinase family protein [Bacteroides fragilis]